MNNKNDCFVHPSSYVDEGATVGKGTKIWHFSHIQKRSGYRRELFAGAEREHSE